MQEDIAMEQLSYFIEDRIEQRIVLNKHLK